MKAHSFLVACFAVSVAIISAYFFLVDATVLAERVVPRNYKYVLTRASASYEKRVFVIGGSSAWWGINTELIQQHFARPAINIADNGGYRFGHKYHYIEQVAKPGDAVIVQLNWFYSSEGPDLVENYIDSMVESNDEKSYEIIRDTGFYYRSLPLLQKIRFVFHDLPFAKAARAMVLNPSDVDRPHLAVHALAVHSAELDRSVREALGNRYRWEGKNDVADLLNCDEYLLGLSILATRNARTNGVRVKFRRAENADGLLAFRDLKRWFEHDAKAGLADLGKYEPTPEFKANVGRFAKLKNRGIDVYFLWPIAVSRKGDECYTTSLSRGLEAYARKVERVVSSAGAPFLDSWELNRFPASCFVDTYAHLNPDCSNARTRRLIGELERSGLEKAPVLPSGWPKLAIRNELDHIESNLMNRLSERLDDLLEALSDGTVAVAKHDRYVFFGKGWSVMESWGIWSVGKTSVFTIRPAGDREPIAIRIGGRYIGKNRKTTVVVNGITIGRYRLQEKSTVRLPSELSDAGYLRVELLHDYPVKPKSLNANSSDERELSFGFESIGLVY